MTDNTEIDVELVLANGNSVSEVNQLARALGTMLEQGTALEKSYNKLFGVTLPKQVAALRAELEAVVEQAAATAKGIGDVPVREISRRLNTGANILRGGGIDTTLQTAAQAGEIARIKNDGALRLLQSEQATNRVLSARADIYRRIAEAGATQGSTPGQINAAYTRASRQLGDTRSGTVVLEEARQFEIQRNQVAEAAAQTRALIQQKANAAEEAAEIRHWANYERTDAAALDRQLTLRQRADAAEAARAKAKADAALVENERFWANYERSDAKAYDRQLAAAQKRAAAPGARTPQTDEQIAARSLSIQRARQTTGGGVPFLQTQIGTLAGFAAIGAVIGGLTSAARATIQFEASLQEMQAVARATEPEMQVLSTAILAVGDNSKFSLKDISDAAIAIAQAGFAAGDVAKILPSVNNLAAATGSSLKDSAALTTSILSIYALSVERTADVTNTLAAAANNSKLTLGQVSTAVQYAGSIASQTGVKFDELITSFANMAQAGAKSGNIIGTGTRALLTELANPTAKFQKELAALGLTVDDVNVRTQGYAGALKNLKDAGFTAETALKSLSVRAANAFALNYKGIDGFAAFQTSITGTNAAVAASEIQMKSLQAQAQRLGNTVVEFVHVAGQPFIAVLAGMVSGLASVLHASSAWAPALVVIGTLLGSFAAANILVWLGNFTSALVGGSSVLKILQLDLVAAELAEGEFAVAANLAAIGIMDLTAAMLVNPVVLLTAGIAALVAVMFGSQIATGAAKAEIENYSAAANEAGQKVAEYTGRVNELEAEVISLTDRHARLTAHTDEVTAATGIAQKKFQDFAGTLDGVGGHVDVLISKLQHLAEVQRQNIVLAQRNQLLNEQEALGKSRQLLGNQQSGLNVTAASTLQRLTPADRTVLGPKGLATLQAISQGKLGNDPASINAAIASLENAIPRLSRTEGAKTFGDLLYSGLTATAPTIADIDTRSAHVSSLQKSLGAAELDATPQAAALRASILASRTRNQDLYASAVRIADPSARLAALAHVQADAAASRQQIEAQAKGFAGGAQLLTDNAQYHDLQNRSGGSAGAQSDGSLASQLKLASAQYRAAKAAHNVAGIRQYGDQIKGLHTRIADAKAATDPEGALASDGNVEEADDVNTQSAIDTANRHRGGGGGARRAARNAGGEAKATAADLKNQIDTLEGTTGPSNILTNLTGLKTLLGQYSTAGRQEIIDKNAATRGSPQELAAQLKAFDGETAKYVAKILHTTLAEATAFLAQEAEDSAKDQAGASGNVLRTGAGDLRKAIGDTQTAFNQSLELALTASNEKFLAEGRDPLTWSDSLKARAAIIDKYGKETIAETLKLIDAALAGDVLRQQQDRYQFERSLTNQRRQLRFGASALGQRTVGDTHRALNDINDRPLAISQAQFNVNDANASLESLQTSRGALSEALGKTTPGSGDANSIQAKIQETDVSIQSARQHLIDMQGVYDELTIHATRFANVNQAVTAAWKVFYDGSGAGKGLMENLSDGLVGVFQNAQQGFSTLISDVLSGTKTMGQAFGAFAKSVLQSMLDLVAKLAAQQLLGFLFNLFSSFIPGVGAGTSLGGAGNKLASKGFAQGTVLRRAAGGGSPYRDSVEALLMPGEAVLSRSAVSMVGEDNLQAMNVAGNRSISGVHAAAKPPPPRDPDMVNVYVVAPNMPPQMGRKDVVAVISQDILSNGQTRALIKQVAMGG